MYKRHTTYSLIILLGIIMASCAQINPLQGGEEDGFAPKIDSLGTKPYSGQTNFTGNEIVIKFNEFIALNNPSDNIVITPQLKNQPDIEVKNKKLTLTFNDTLLENTTYTVSFNHAVTDITEKNDSIFQFVFSTGDYIDSLSISGQVTDAFTNQPNEGFLVGLYSVEATTPFDSIPMNDQPIYIAQTNRNGQFKIDYLKEDDYYVFAIGDLNKNLKLEPAELRGFLLDAKIHVGLENEPISILTFPPAEAEAKLQTTNFTYPGKLEFIFNTEPDSFSVSTNIDLIQEKTDRSDSLIYWLKSNPTSKMNFIISLNNELDTIKPLYKNTPQGNTPVTLTITDNLLKEKLMPNEKLRLTFSEPIGEILPNGLHFYTKDSTEIDLPNYSIQNVRELVFDTIPEKTKLVKIDSGAVVSPFNHSTTADKWIKLETLTPDYFGVLLLNIDSVFAGPVFVDLLNEQNEVIQTLPYSQNMTFNDLIPGKYQLRLVFDENEDGNWSTGSLKEKRLPERVIYNKELINIKSRWEKEVDWILKKDTNTEEGS